MVQKIKYLCKRIHSVEWSGILFYSVEGSIRDPKNMVVTLQDILPMDKGDKTYTEYELDDRYVDYIMADPIRYTEWKVGHIHSHHSMGVFFSGTDMAELNDNATAHNFYLSFIVNNYMDFCAKIAYVAKAETVTEAIPYFALDENGEQYKVGENKFTVSKEKLYVHNCIIDSPAETVTVSEDFAGKVTGIIKDADNRRKVAQVAAKSWQQKQTKTPYHQKTKNTPTPPKVVYDGFPEPDDFFEDDSEIIGVSEDVELFAITLLRGTTPPDENVKTIQDALEELELIGISSKQLVESITDNYLPLYGQLYDGDESPTTFEDVLTEIVDCFEVLESKYSILSGTIMYLKNVLKKFQENGATVQ